MITELKEILSCLWRDSFLEDDNVIMKRVFVLMNSKKKMMVTGLMHDINALKCQNDILFSLHTFCFHQNVHIC